MIKIYGTVIENVGDGLTRSDYIRYGMGTDRMGEDANIITLECRSMDALNATVYNELRDRLGSSFSVPESLGQAFLARIPQGTWTSIPFVLEAAEYKTGFRVEVRKGDLKPYICEHPALELPIVLRTENILVVIADSPGSIILALQPYKNEFTVNESLILEYLKP